MLRELTTPATPSETVSVPGQSRRSTVFPFLESIMKAAKPVDLVTALSQSSKSDIEHGLDAIKPKELYDLFDAGRIFESVITLGRVFLAYEIYRSKGGIWGQLPPTLEHNRCWQILHFRLVPFVLKNARFAAVMKHAYDLAMDLITLNREREALEYLLATRPGYVEDHEFWIFCCINNLVVGGAIGYLDAAMIQGRAIQAGKLKVPSKCREAVEKFMQNLTSMQPPQPQSSGPENPWTNLF